MINLPINEIFETLQGEGTFTGTPSTFVRLQFCDVGCPWCDTKHTWKLEAGKKIEFGAMMHKTEDADTYSELSVSDLIQHGIKTHPRHIVITGGEPCHYDLIEFTTRLQIAGHTTQIETSGTRQIRCSEQTFVTVSPKIDMPGGYKVIDQPLIRANEIKMPVGKPRDVEQVKMIQHRLGNLRKDMPPIFLQPLSQSPKATELCIAAASENNWRVSIQTHKFLGLR